MDEDKGQERPADAESDRGEQTGGMLEAGSVAGHGGGSRSPTARSFSSHDDPQHAKLTTGPVGEIGFPVYVGVAANVLDEIRKQHCLGQTPGSVLREHLSRRSRSAADLHDGRWQVVPCTSLEEAFDFRAYLVQRLKPLLNSENRSWKREYSVLYHRFVQELYASEAVGCEGLKATFIGPGVYVYYHNDKSLWQPVSKPPQAKESSEFELLKKAIALSRVGDRRPAREILVHVISSNPHNELAWLWYAYNLERNSDRIKVLQECLSHNPECKEAKDRLIYLQTTEALRVRVAERRKDLSGQVADTEARLEALQERLREEEMGVQEAEEVCERARAQVAGTRDEITRLAAELDQLREQLVDS
jgi:hypothetical protein